MIQVIIWILYTILVFKISKHTYPTRKFHIIPTLVVFKDRSWVFTFTRIMIVSDLQKVSKNLNKSLGR